MTGDVVATAKEWLGTPYRNRASVKGQGADCLGLVLGVWHELGGCPVNSLPNYAGSWHHIDPNEELWEAARRFLASAGRGIAPGDIALLRMRDGASARHLGIISGTWREPRLIHAYSGRGVVESFLGKPLRRRIVARFRFPTE